MVWKKLVLVKRRAVDQSVCLPTIEQAEPAELTIQVNAASISFLYFWLLISESIMWFIFQDNNGILFKQEKSEILENIINVGCWIELFCNVYYISQSLALRAVLLVCKWRHGGHVGGQEQKHFSPLGNELYFDANLAEKFLLFWPPTWPRCHVVANQEFRISVYQYK